MQILLVKKEYLVGLYFGQLVKLNRELKIVEKGQRMFPFLMMIFPLLGRLFRYQIYAKKLLPNQNIVLSTNKGLLLIDINLLKCKKIETPSSFNKSLDLDIINLSGKKYIIYSNYSTNKNLENVDIYIAPLENLNSFELFKTFNNKHINHIHSYAQKKYSDDIYVNVGDTGESVGIWRIVNDIDQPIPWLVGSQTYRAVLTFWHEDNFWLINDNPSGKNNILLLRSNQKDKPEIIKKYNIDGPCIYGEINDTNIFFSTSCEPKNSSILDFLPILFVNQKAKLYSFNFVDQELNEMAYSRKDPFSSVLFGFGTFQLPLMLNKQDDIYFYSASLSKGMTSNNVVKYWYKNCYSVSRNERKVL